MTTRLTDEQIEALRRKAVEWMHPNVEADILALIDEVCASRSSSGLRERVEAPAARTETPDRVPDVAALLPACRTIVALSNPDDIVSNGEWRRAVADLRAALARSPRTDSRERDLRERGPMTWGLSTDEESFHGHYASKEEALANVESEIGPLEPGQRFWVGGGRLWLPTLSVDADRLFDALAEHAGDECGEIAEDWLSAVARKDADALEEEIHAVVLRWLERTGNMPTFYCCEVTEVHFAPGRSLSSSTTAPPSASTHLGPVLSAEINALPERVRAYIHDLEAQADPAGTVQDLACAQENVAALSVALRESEGVIAAARKVEGAAEQKDVCGAIWIVPDAEFQALSLALADAPPSGDDAREAGRSQSKRYPIPPDRCPSGAHPKDYCRCDGIPNLHATIDLLEKNLDAAEARAVTVVGPPVWHPGPPPGPPVGACTCVVGPSSVVPSPSCPQHGHSAIPGRK